MQIEEYVPAITPTIKGSANILISSTPITYKQNTMINVVSDVKSDLDNVWLTEEFTTSFNSSVFLFHAGSHEYDRM